MWMAATAEVMAAMEATTVTTEEDPVFISLATGMAAGATPNIIAIEELRVAGLDIPVVVAADTRAVGTMEEVEAEDDIEPLNS